MIHGVLADTQAVLLDQCGE